MQPVPCSCLCKGEDTSNLHSGCCMLDTGICFSYSVLMQTLRDVSYSFSCPHLVVGSLRQAQFSSNQFCHSSHVSVDTVHPSVMISASVFLFFFSRVVPSPESLFRDSLVIASSCPNHLSIAFLHLSVIFSTFSLSQMLSFLTWSLSVWPHAHLHIFIYVTSSFFTWELDPVQQYGRRNLAHRKLAHRTLAHRALAHRTNLCSNRWAKVRWAKVRWANVRWANVRWANVRWAKVRAPTIYTWLNDYLVYISLNTWRYSPIAQDACNLLSVMSSTPCPRVYFCIHAQWLCRVLPMQISVLQNK